MKIKGRSSMEGVLSPKEIYGTKNKIVSYKSMTGAPPSALEDYPDAPERLLAESRSIREGVQSNKKFRRNN